MTLAKQTTLLMIIALSIFFAGTFFITINHSKSYFEEQLAQNAQDTATAIGLTLSKQGRTPTDSTIMLLTISAVFDRGHFSRIWIEDTTGKIVVKRYLQVLHQSVPNWFVRLMYLQNEPKSALIMKDWQQLGEVVVQSDSTTAYAALWHTAKKFFVLFLLTILGIILASTLYIKAMFRSLSRIVHQAEDIGIKNLYTLDNPPKFKELRTLSTTMNSMVEKLKVFFSMQIAETERLRAKVYQDSLTLKGNRRYFFQQVNQYLTDENYFLPGVLFLIEISGLSEFNQKYDYQQGDQIILKVSQYLDELLVNMHVFILARLDSPSFAAIVLEQNTIRLLLKDMYQKLQLFLKSEDPMLGCYIGVVKCKFGESTSNLLAEVDNILKIIPKSADKYAIASDVLDDLDTADQTWRTTVLEAIQQKAIHLYCQPVKFKQETFHKECFIKLLSKSAEIGANYFFPIVNQYSLGGKIDKLVIQEIMQAKENTTFSINLSGDTIKNKDTQREFLLLVEQLTKKTERKVHFELSEFLMVENMAEATILIRELGKLGHVIGLDRIGVNLTPLEFLRKSNLTFLKLDGSLTEGIEKSELKQEIITNWITTAQGFDLTLIATSVETKSQWETLRGLGVIYFQGNYIQSPLLIENIIAIKPL